MQKWKQQGCLLIGVHIRRGDYKEWCGGKYYYENNLYKYTYGETESSAKAQSLLSEAKKCFPDAFIVKFKNGIKIK